MGELHHWHLVTLVWYWTLLSSLSYNQASVPGPRFGSISSFAHQAHIALSGLMSSIVQQGSSLDSCLTFLYSHIPLTIKCVFIWWRIINSSLSVELQINMITSRNYNSTLSLLNLLAEECKIDHLVSEGYLPQAIPACRAKFIARHQRHPKRGMPTETSIFAPTAHGFWSLHGCPH